MASEWVLKTAIIEEIANTPVMTLIYEDLVLWLRELKNITVEFVSIPKENLQRLLNEDLQEGAEWLFFSCEFAQFSTNRSSSSPRLSLPGHSSSTYILSATPTKKTVPSLHFIDLEPTFVNGLVASLVIISMFVSVIFPLQRFRISTWLRDFIHRFLDNLWRTSILFFFEPLIDTHRNLSWRIAMSVWLIAISFIYINMSSDLKSKFTETKYGEIKSLKDIPREEYGNVIVIEDFVEDVFVNRMAEIDDDYRELKKRMQRVDEITFFTSFGRINEGNEYRIIAEINGKIGLKEVHYATSMWPPRGLVSFSEPLYNTFTSFPISRHASSKTVEAINVCLLITMECALMAKYYNEMDFLFFGMKWSKPGETFENMTFGDINSVLYVYILGCLLSTFILIVEYLTAFLLKVKTK